MEGGGIPDVLSGESTLLGQPAFFFLDGETEGQCHLVCGVLAGLELSV